MSARTVLLSGFEPFGGDSVNPSWRVAQALDGQEFQSAGGRWRIAALMLPCRFGGALDVLLDAVRRRSPTLVLALGQASGRAAVTPERIAINVDDARIADNAGAQPIDRPVVEGGPAAYFSSLPVKAMVSAMQGAGLPAAVSQSAGTFVCNHVFYGLMHALQADRRGVRGGFMHLPCLPEQVGASTAPSMALDDQVRAVRLALQAALTHTTDLRLSGGAEA